MRLDKVRSKENNNGELVEPNTTDPIIFPLQICFLRDRDVKKY